MISDQEATKRLAKRQGKTVVTDFILIDKDDKKPHEVVRILDNDPVRKLLNRGTITREQFEAAERLYSDWYIGGMAPRVVKPPKFVQVDEGSPELNESEMRGFCMRRYNNAMSYVGKNYNPILTELVIQQNSLIESGQKLFNRKQVQQARAVATEVLVLALSELVDFYS
ncbi:MAG: hypothetical protein OCD03_13180 [Hyphomicrobiales bacterium]